MSRNLGWVGLSFLSSRVSNGTALCKIHHAAYDQNFLGIDADYKVHVRADLLQEVDGSILKYGIQAPQGKNLQELPASGLDRPDRELLGERLQNFRRIIPDGESNS